MYPTLGALLRFYPTIHYVVRHSRDGGYVYEPAHNLPTALELTRDSGDVLEWTASGWVRLRSSGKRTLVYPTGA